MKKDARYYQKDELKAYKEYRALYEKTGDPMLLQMSEDEHRHYLYWKRKNEK